MVMLLFLTPNTSGGHIVISFCLIMSGFAVVADDIKSSNISNQLSDVSQAVTVLKKAVGSMSAYLGDVDVVGTSQPKCIKIHCRIMCFNGKQSEIAKDITIALTSSLDDNPCLFIEELYLYNYKFQDAILPVGFLSIYTLKIRLIYIGISNITTIEDGAFGGGIINHIILEELRLEKIDKAFFTNITNYFKGFSIIQSNVQLQSVYPDFLDLVQNKIQYLRLQTGTNCLRNVTATEPTLGALTHADFSNNFFNDTLLSDSFQKLTMVERLVLTNSNIEFLPNYIFQDMKYLELLDISHNKLTTISRSIFGINDIPSNLRIYGDSNPWHCDCTLVNNMNVLFKISDNEMLCSTPEKFENLSVFDRRICSEHDAEVTGQTYRPTTTPKTTTLKTTTQGLITSTITSTRTTDQIIYVPTISTAGTVKPNEIVPLECRLANKPLINNTTRQLIRWPQLNFSPKCSGGLSVQIAVDQRDSQSSFGLFWFSRTTKEYIMMELLPDEFGLGCYFTMPLLTFVTKLMPNLAYTFCLVDDNQNKVSPFSCKSVHVGTNLNTHYSSWLSKKMRAKGISVMVFGVVLFMFLGIAAVFLILKRKPIWLKGSKRVITPKFRSGEVVVLPRSNTAEYLQYKEDMISRFKGQRSISYASRYNSVESLASSDSYMEMNLYEIIPTYLSFDEIPQVKAPSHPGSHILSDSIYQTPEYLADTGSVKYAQITPRTKRISSDPLPAVPSSDVSDVPH